MKKQTTIRLARQSIGNRLITWFSTTAIGRRCGIQARVAIAINDHSSPAAVRKTLRVSPDEANVLLNGWWEAVSMESLTSSEGLVTPELRSALHSLQDQFLPTYQLRMQEIISNSQELEEAFKGLPTQSLEENTELSSLLTEYQSHIETLQDQLTTLIDDVMTQEHQLRNAVLEPMSDQADGGQILEDCKHVFEHLRRLPDDLDLPNENALWLLLDGEIRRIGQLLKDLEENPQEASCHCDVKCLVDEFNRVNEVLQRQVVERPELQAKRHSIEAYGQKVGSLCSRLMEVM